MSFPPAAGQKPVFNVQSLNRKEKHDISQITCQLSIAPIYLTDFLIINRAGQISIHITSMELFISVANMSHKASRDAQLLFKH